MELILLALWVFLPAGLANASPVIASRALVFRGWKTPIDFGKTFRGKRIFGDNKTWRGLIFGTMVGALTGYLQSLLLPEYGLELSQSTAIIAGGLMGFGALFGDAMESFFKRQMDIPAGESWFPFDQFDYIIGALLVVSPVVTFSLQEYVTIAIVWFSIHVVSVYIGFLLKLRDKPI